MDWTSGTGRVLIWETAGMGCAAVACIASEGEANDREIGWKTSECRVSAGS